MSKFVVWFFMMIALFSVVDSELKAQTEPPSEYQVKAAFLYNFAKFIKWPVKAFADSADSIVIGILGEYPFGDYLDRVIEGKTIKGRKMTQRRLKQTDDLRSCHILFISSSEKASLKQILKKLKESNVLTVGEMNHFARDGGIIGFIIRNNKVRIEINVDTVKRGGLELSSKLLKAAEIVKDRH